MGLDYTLEMIEAEKRLKEDPDAIKKMLESNAKELVTDHLIDSYIKSLEGTLGKISGSTI